MEDEKESRKGEAGRARTPYILGPMRLPFVVLAPVCVLLGLASAVFSSAEIGFGQLFLVFLGGIAAHISVNAFNEYFDFRSGLDFKTGRTPFSGGSGTLPERPEFAKYALVTAVGASAVVVAVGAAFVGLRGPLFLPVGIAGLLLIVAYTPWIVRSPLLCLIAPGLGFGPLMVMGTHFALAGEYSWTAFFASAVPFFLVSNLLLLNQFPDLEADRSVGRRNLPIVIGRKRSSLVYTGFVVLAGASIAAGVSLGALPRLTLLGLLPLGLGLGTAPRLYRQADHVEKLTPLMGLNVVMNLATPSLVALGLFLGGP